MPGFKKGGRGPNKGVPRRKPIKPGEKAPAIYAVPAPRSRESDIKDDLMLKSTRAWFRCLCEDPAMRSEVADIIHREVAMGCLTNFWKAIEHGYGKPPAAVDVKVSGNDDAPVVYEVRLAGGEILAPSVAKLPTSSTAEQSKG